MPYRVFLETVIKCVSFQALADLVQENDLEVGRLYPPLQNIQKCSVKIAAAIMQRAYETGKYCLRFHIVINVSILAVCSINY